MSASLAQYKPGAVIAKVLVERMVFGTWSPSSSSV